MEILYARNHQFRNAVGLQEKKKKEKKIFDRYVNNSTCDDFG